jgi:solute carrier family 25 carnitine/acylcarnitine transporter 20/29
MHVKAPEKLPKDTWLEDAQTVNLLFTLMMLGITPAIQKKLSEGAGTMGTNTALAVGALTGLFTAATMSHLMDTIKTNIQGDLDRTKYGTVTKTGQKLIESKGLPNVSFL